MKEPLSKLMERCGGCPALLHELSTIARYPEHIQPYHLSDLLRSYKILLESQDSLPQKEMQRAISVLTDAGIRPATKTDDIAFRVMSEVLVGNRWNLRKM